MAPTTIAVLASGSGSNLQALIDADLGAPIGLVICNNPGARALSRAEAADIPTATIDHRTFDRRDDFDRALVAALQQHRVELVVLAGFMRIIGEAMLDAYGGRIVNIHPALLPAYPGLDAQRQAIDGGARISGCTVHLVDAGVDTGPILAQAALQVRRGERVESLGKRILALEHRLFPAVIAAIVAGRLESGRLLGTLGLSADGVLFSP